MTHTVSVAVILLELNGQLVHVLPMFVGTLAGFIVGTSVTMSLFDTVIQLKGLPFLPAVRSSQKYMQTAGEIMNMSFLFLPKNCCMRDLVSIFKLEGMDRRAIPITESKENKYFLKNI